MDGEAGRARQPVRTALSKKAYRAVRQTTATSEYWTVLSTLYM